jgi:hypothetical protein
MTSHAEPELTLALTVGAVLGLIGYARHADRRLAEQLATEAMHQQEREFRRAVAFATAPFAAARWNAATESGDSRDDAP